MQTQRISPARPMSSCRSRAGRPRRTCVHAIMHPCDHVLTHVVLRLLHGGANQIQPLSNVPGLHAPGARMGTQLGVRTPVRQLVATLRKNLAATAGPGMLALGPAGQIQGAPPAPRCGGSGASAWEAGESACSRETARISPFKGKKFPLSSRPHTPPGSPGRSTPRSPWGGGSTGTAGGGGEGGVSTGTEGRQGVSAWQQ